MDPRDGGRGSRLSAALLFPNKREVACASLGFLKAFEVIKRKVALADLGIEPSLIRATPYETFRVTNSKPLRGLS